LATVSVPDIVYRYWTESHEIWIMKFNDLLALAKVRVREFTGEAIKH